MTPQTIAVILLTFPLIIGAFIAMLNSNAINHATENIEAWIRRARSNVSVKSNWFSRFVLNPILWMLVKFSDWTDGFSHRGLKNGIRIAATFYLVAAWCYIVYAVFMLAIIIAIAVSILYVIFKILINSNENVKQGYNSGRKIVGSVGPGKRINQDTGRIQEEGILGWNDTDERIDPETGKVQTKSIFGWNDTETRINQETGNIQKDGLFGYNDTDTRINPDSGIIEKNGILGWADTDERINPETGKRQKKGLLGWVDE